MTMPEANTVHSRALPFLLGATGVLLISATLLLWAHYGTAVFLEIIQAGLAACFG
jgi:hypothetical protein